MVWHPVCKELYQNHELACLRAVETHDLAIMLDTWFGRSVNQGFKTEHLLALSVSSLHEIVLNF